MFVVFQEREIMAVKGNQHTEGGGCILVSYASIGWLADLSLAGDQVSKYMQVILLRVETGI